MDNKARPAACRPRHYGLVNVGRYLPVLALFLSEHIGNAGTDLRRSLKEEQIMRDFREAKTMAKTLRLELTDREVYLSHSNCLEIVARQFGYGNWNMLAAKIDTSDAPGQRLTMPEGWRSRGRNSEYYELGIDPDAKNGTALIYHWDERTQVTDFATMMQSIAADEFRGKRMQLSAVLKTAEVTGVGTLWMRVDGRSGRRLGFDNMEQRPKDGPLTKTCDWTERQIVLDIPDAAQNIHYGFFLRGTIRYRFN